MTVASLMERLKSGVAVTPVTPSNPAGVTTEKSPLSLFLLKKTAAVTPVTPVTPQKTVARNEVAPAPTTGEGQPLPKFSVSQPWRALDREFQAHYWQCTACKAGGRTRGPLCPQGQQLSVAVHQAFATA